MASQANKASKQRALHLIAFDRSEPFNTLAPLPPKVEIETLRTLKRSIAATSALAELRGVGGLIPNQALLIRAIILQEAKLSSEIENIVTTNDRLYRAFSEHAEKTDPNTKEVLRYEEALWHGYQHQNAGRPLSANLFIQLVQIIKQTDVGIRTLPGTQIVNDRTREVIYTPPQGEKLLRTLLDNLSEYIYEDDDIDALIKMAILHYQFEAIHPFSDGNGRSGRVLNILFLLEKGLLDIPVLYLSRYIIKNKTRYYKGLKNVTESAEWEGWILFMLDAIEETAIDARNRIVGIRKALDQALETARTQMTKGYTKELIELIFQQPYTRIHSLEEAGIAKRQTASQHLKELERIGLLRSFKFGREILYVNETLMTLLTAEVAPAAGG